jgi:hypothetical protein
MEIGSTVWLSGNKKHRKHALNRAGVERSRISPDKKRADSAIPPIWRQKKGDRWTGMNLNTESKDADSEERAEEE